MYFWTKTFNIMNCPQMNCNCIDCIWKRIQNCYRDKIFTTIRGRRFCISELNSEKIILSGVEETQNTLFPIKKRDLQEAIICRQNNNPPNQYPSVATSYKWGILNDPDIWPY